MGKVCLMVDGNNLFYSQKHTRWDIDPRRMLDWVATIGEVAHASWYVGINPDATKDTTGGFRAALTNLGYRCVTKEVKNYGGAQKANLDVELTVDALLKKDLYDTFVLFSGDNDFTYLVSTLNTLGKKTIVVSAGVIGNELRNEADLYVDYGEIRSQVEKVRR